GAFHIVPRFHLGGSGEGIPARIGFVPTAVPARCASPPGHCRYHGASPTMPLATAPGATTLGTAPPSDHRALSPQTRLAPHAGPLRRPPGAGARRWQGAGLPARAVHPGPLRI